MTNINIGTRANLACGISKIWLPIKRCLVTFLCLAFQILITPAVSAQGGPGGPGVPLMCNPGETDIGGVCMPISCPPPQVLTGGVCMTPPPTCTPPEVDVGGVCIIPGPTVPVPPSNITADTRVFTDTILTFDWTPSTIDGGSPIVAQDIFLFRGSGCSSSALILRGTSRAIDSRRTFQRLQNNVTPGEALSIHVTARNSIGSSAPSNCLDFTVPDNIAPTITSVQVRPVSGGSTVGIGQDVELIMSTSEIINEPTITILGQAVTPIRRGTGARWEASFTIPANATSGPVTFEISNITDVRNLAGTGATAVTIGSAPTIVVDTTAPTLTSILRQSPLAETTSFDSLSWRVTFSEAVENVAASDFSLSGTSASISRIFSVGNGVFDVSVGGGNLADLDGTVTLGLAANATINDEAGNALVSTSATGAVESYTLDNTGPSLISITREIPTSATTDANQLTWRVVFDDAPTDLANVGSTAFNVSGTTGFVDIREDGDGFLITVEGGDLADLNGTVTLTLDPDNRILDSLFNPLSNTVPTGTNDNTFEVENDSTAPTLVSIERTNPTTSPTDADTLTWTFTFSEAVTAPALTDFTVTGTTATVTYIGDESASSSGTADQFGVRISGGDLAELNGDVSIALNGTNQVRDLAGNALTGSAPSGTNNNSYTLDNGAPTVSAPMPPSAVNGPFDVEFTFSEDVNGFDPSDFTLTNATVTISGGPRVFTVTITPDGNGDVSVELPANAVTDASGNGNEAFNATISVELDTTAPSLTFVSLTSNNPQTNSRARTGDVITLNFTANEPITEPSATIAGQTISLTPASRRVSRDAQTKNGGQAKASLGVAIGFPPSTNWQGQLTVSALIPELRVVPISISNIQDVAGNTTANVTSTTDDSSVRIDNSEVELIRITRNQPTTTTTNADSLSWTVEFNEPVRPLAVSDFQVTGTTATLAIAAISERIYTATLSGGDLANLNGTVTLNVARNNNIVDSVGNFLLNTTPEITNENTFNVQNDTTLPTLVSIERTSPTGEVTASNTLTWTFEFSEPVTAPALTDFTVTGTTATVTYIGDESASSSGTATRFGVRISGGDLAELDGEVSIALNATNQVRDGNENALANSSPSGTNQNTYLLDNTSPTVTITGVPAIIRGPFTATFTFSEAVRNISIGTITVTNATVSNLTGNGTSFTALITPDGNGQVTIDVQEDATTDSVGNANLAATQAVSTFDGTAPTVVIAGVPATTSEPFTATFTFSEAVTGFTVGDITLGNATASDFAGSDTVFTALITPEADGQVTINVAANAAQDGGGNANQAATQAISTFDGTAPTVAITGVPATASEAFTVTFIFSEAVTGFVANDIALGNATASDFAGNDTAFTALITPEADGQVTIDVAENVAQDGGGNGNQAATQAISTFDGTAPTIEITGVPATTSEPFTATFTFSEAVTDFVANDITLGNATASDFAGNDTAFTALITPEADGQVTIDVAENVAKDSVGNGNQAATQAISTFDGTAPNIVSITRQSPQSQVTADDSLTWRVSFSEAVDNVDITDFSASGTTAILSLSAVTQTAYDITLSQGDLENLNGTVTLSVVSANNIADLNGNTLEDVTPSGANDNSFDVQNDVTSPTVEIIGIPDMANGPFDVTFMFSEDVQGFDEDDVNVTNGDLSNLRIRDASQSRTPDAGLPQSQLKGLSGQAFIGTIMPNGEGALLIEIIAGGIADSAGNTVEPEAGSTTIAASAEIMVDTTAPQASIDALPADVRGPFTVTIRFNEAVSGFEIGDINVTNGTTETFENVDAQTYTALVTPATEGEITVTVAAAAAQDDAGNDSLAAEPVSTIFIDETRIRNRTARIINNFLARRADQLTANDPDLSRRLQATGTQGRLTGNAELHSAQLAFNGTASGDEAQLARLIGADAAAKTNLWVEATLSSLSQETADQDLFLLHAGVDYRLNENTLIGVMAQYDWADETDNNQNFDISGKGWLVGPYLVSRLSDNLVLDGRVAWGQSDNDVSPSQTYEDSFDTERWLLKGQLTGEFETAGWRINPAASFIYFSDQQKAYTDSLGILIPKQTVDLGRITFGPRLSKTFQQEGQSFSITPNVNLRGIWDFEQPDLLDINTGLASASTDALRARIEGGLDVNLNRSTRLTVNGFYDGIGTTNFEAYGAKFGISFPLH